MTLNGLTRAEIAGVLLLVSLGACRRPIPPAADRDAIVAAVDAFHQALARGDGPAATALLSADAQILEEGDSQTREEYLRDHLGADLAFAKAIPSIRQGIIVRQESNVAWTTATSRTQGRYLGREINSVGVELMVLSKQSDG